MNSAPIAIRPAQASDLDQLHRLEVECVGGTALPESQMKWLLQNQAPDATFVVRVAYEPERPDELVGFICWKNRPDPITPACEILNLSVGKNFRDERVEHSLLADAIDVAMKDGLIGMAVNVPRSNLPAAAFYLSHAFNLGHTVERYYEDGSAMEVFMKRLK